VPDEGSERVGPDGAVGDWIFAPDYRRLTNTRADLLSHRFDRLRHSVGTQLVADGKLLKAQARLGHRGPATTLRHYAHAVPLDDLDFADSIDDMLNGVGTGPE
jgi:integrase